MSRTNNQRSNRAGRTDRKPGGRKQRPSGRGRTPQGARGSARGNSKGKANRRPNKGTNRPSRGAASQQSGSTATRQPAKSTGSSVRSVKLCVERIKCIKKTGELFSKDKMVFTGIKKMNKVVEKNGRPSIKPNSTRGMTINAGKFKKGDKVNYSKPKTLASIAIGPASLPWPRTFGVAVVGVEKDGSQLKKIIDNLIEKFDNEAASKAGEVAAAAVVSAIASGTGTGAMIGSMIPIPGVGTAAGAAVGAGVMAISSAIRASTDDDVFPPKGVQLTLDSKPNRKGRIGGKKTLKLKRNKAEYELTYFWEAV